MKLFYCFIVLGLVVSGCTSVQPVCTNTTDTVTYTDTTYIQFNDPEILKSFIQCDSSYTAQWIDNIRLVDILDSFKAIPAKIVVKKQTIYTTQTKLIDKIRTEKGETIIIKKIHPLTWVFACTTILFLVSFIIAFVLLFKKLQ